MSDLSTYDNSRSQARVSALKNAVYPNKIKLEKTLSASGKPAPISEYFGSSTFGLAQMREKIPRDAYSALMRTLDHGKKLVPEATESIASAIKEWAVGKGCTHFCHWFQ